jgi:ribosomal protein S27E
MSKMHAIECNNCKRVLYECDVQEGAIYETPLDFYDISECPDCGHLMVFGNYNRIEDLS